VKLSRIVFPAIAVVAIVLIEAFTDAPLGKTTVAVVIGVLVLWMGLAMIRGLAQPVPEPPEAGQLRKVKLTYRCDICGSEVRMTVAASAAPEPPRHCLEDMELVTPVE